MIIQVFDAVISSAALHHFSKEEKEILYKKIYDSLKDGGQFINSDKFAKDEEEEKRFMQEYVQNTDSEKHIDTPLCLDNEKYLLDHGNYVFELNYLKRKNIIRINDEGNLYSQYENFKYWASKLKN